MHVLELFYLQTYASKTYGLRSLAQTFRQHLLSFCKCQDLTTRTLHSSDFTEFKILLCYFILELINEVRLRQRNGGKRDGVQLDYSKKLQILCVLFF